MSLKRILVGFGGCVWLAGCGADDGTEPEQREQEQIIEIASWWTEGGEQAALSALLAEHEKEHPNVRVINTVSEVSNFTREQLDERLAEGNPPTTFQDNTGNKVLRWALFNGIDDSESKLDSLNELADRAGWENIPSDILDLNTISDTVYAVPVNVHRQNNAYYNKAVLDAEGLEAPESVTELRSFVEALVDAGYEHPPCVGNQWSWTMDFFVFEAALPAIAGPDFHVSYWAGNEDATGPQVIEALELALELWPYFNTDADELTWAEGIDKMMLDGKEACVMSVMGDWAKGHLEEVGWVGGTDFLQLPFPGSQGIYVVSGDSFPLPRGIPDKDAGLDLLETFGSSVGQTAFNKIKGSIPARVDVNSEEFDVTTRAQLDDFKNNRLVPSFRVATPAGTFPDLGVAVKQMLSDGDIEVAVRELENGYPDLIE